MNFDQVLSVAGFYGGIGGGLLGTEWAGLQVFYNHEPRDFFNEETWTYNFPEVAYSHQSPPNWVNTDLLIGSPDCKQFSGLGMKRKDRKAGRLQKISQEEFNQDVLLKIDYIKFLQKVGRENPRVFILENVPNILKHFWFEENILFTSLLEGQARQTLMAFPKYKIQTITLDAYDFGVPQHRKRVFVIGAKDFTPNFNWARLFQEDSKVRGLYNQHYVGSTVGDAFRNLNNLPNMQLPKHTPTRVFHFRKLAPGESYYGTQNNRRLYWEKPSWTIASHCSRFVHPIEPRVLTARENARIMGFPDNFVFFGKENGQLDQIGKSIVPQITMALGYYIKTELELCQV